MEDILSRPAPTADHRLSYGPDPSQFGDLWLPPTTGKSLLPLVVFFHGGWWKSEYDLGYAGHLCADLKRHGIATWSVEYRRVGSTGGGYPATFQDAAAGFEFAATLAKAYPLDLARVITMGHSAGGHLAFWVAGRHHIDSHSDLYQPGRRYPCAPPSPWLEQSTCVSPLTCQAILLLHTTRMKSSHLWGVGRPACPTATKRGIRATCCRSTCRNSSFRARKTAKYPQNFRRDGQIFRAAAATIRWSLSFPALTILMLWIRRVRHGHWSATLYKRLLVETGQLGLRKTISRVSLFESAHPNSQLTYNWIFLPFAVSFPNFRVTVISRSLQIPRPESLSIGRVPKLLKVDTSCVTGLPAWTNHRSCRPFSSVGYLSFHLKHVRQ